MVLKITVKEMIFLAVGVAVAVLVGFYLLSSREPAISDKQAKAESLVKQGRVPEAIRAYEDLLPLAETSLGVDHPGLGTILNNLACLYEDPEKSIPLLQRALKIRERALGPGHRLVALTLNHLALSYQDCNSCPDPEPLFKRVLQIRKQELGAKHPVTRESLNNLAWLYRHRGQDGKAERLIGEFR